MIVGGSAPIARAGADTSVPVGFSVTLDGSESHDPDGDEPLGYNWQIISAPAGSVSSLSDPDTAEPSFTPDMAGDYEVALVVVDAEGFSSVSDEVVITAVDAGFDFFTVLPPCRVVDTRSPSGEYGGPALSHGSVRLFKLAEKCGVPFSAKAIFLNVTAVTPTGVGYLTLHPGDLAPPLASSVNFSSGQTRTNNAIVPLATDGTGLIGVKSFISGAGEVHLVLDISGYFDD